MNRPAPVAIALTIAAALLPGACSSDAPRYADGGIVVTSGSRVTVIEPDGATIAVREFDADVRVSRVSHSTGALLVEVGGDGNGAGSRAFLLDARLEAPIDLGVLDSPSSGVRWRTLDAGASGWLTRSGDDYLVFDEVSGGAARIPASEVGIGQRTVDGMWLVGVDDLFDPDDVVRFDPETSGTTPIELEWFGPEWASAVTGLDARRPEALVSDGQILSLPVRRSDGGFAMVVSDPDGSYRAIVTTNDDGVETSRVEVGPVRHLGADVTILDSEDGVYRVIETTSGAELMTYRGGVIPIVDELGDRLLLLDGVLIDVERELRHDVALPEVVVDASPAADRLLILSTEDGERRVMIAPVHAPERAEFVVEGEPSAWLDAKVFDR